MDNIECNSHAVSQQTKGVQYLGIAHTIQLGLQIDRVQNQLGRLLRVARLFDGIGAQNFVSAAVRFICGWDGCHNEQQKTKRERKKSSHVVKHLSLLLLLLLLLCVSKKI